jgi:hypothetical protein
MCLLDFVVSYFWGWDAHVAQLRCADEVDDDIWIWSTRRGLKPKVCYTTQTMVTVEIFPFKEKIHMAEPGNSYH